MAVVWPASLPDWRTGTRETHQRGFIRSPMDAGPAKMRRRFTFTSRQLAGTMHMTNAQKATFDEWFNVTLASGSLSFKMIDEANGEQRTWRFVDTPEFSMVAPSANSAGGAVALWLVSLTIERVT